MSNFELIYQYLKDLSKESVELFDDLMDRAEQGGVFSEKDISDLCNLLFLVEKDLENESSYNIQWTLKDRIMEMIIILVIEKESPICFEAIVDNGDLDPADRARVKPMPENFSELTDEEQAEALASPQGIPTTTTLSFLICKYGGLIEPYNSGQQYDPDEPLD